MKSLSRSFSSFFAEVFLTFHRKILFGALGKLVLKKHLLIQDFRTGPGNTLKLSRIENVLMLRNEFRVKNEKTKKSIKMSEDVPIIPTEETRAIESNLKKLNALAAEKKITTRLNGDVKINLETILGEILPDLIKKKITLINTEFVCKPALSTTSFNVKENSHSMSSPSVDSSRSGSISTASIHSLQNSSHSINTSVLDMEALSFQNYTYPIVLYKELMDVDSDKNSFYYTITHRLQSLYYQRIPPNEALFLHFLWIKRLLSLMKPSRKKDKLLQEERPLSDFGIKTLEFEINQKSLHRVFNRGSQNFDKGGRFYGPSYQGMAKNIRKSILINGHETTELDFSGLHIRMLYHQLGQEFNEDPYTIDDGSLRAEYKLVSLISINAKAQGAHIAVKDALEEGGFEIAEDLKKVQALMKNYQERHEPIKEFLFSGAGIDLQNKDSQIMEKILMRLHDQGICGLPIHDSVLVEKEHADLLYEIMMKAYGEVMGFEPVLKLAG